MITIPVSEGSFFYGLCPVCGKIHRFTSAERLRLWVPELSYYAYDVRTSRHPVAQRPCATLKPETYQGLLRQYIINNNIDLLLSPLVLRDLIEKVSDYDSFYEVLNLLKTYVTVRTSK